MANNENRLCTFIAKKNFQNFLSKINEKLSDSSANDTDYIQLRFANSGDAKFIEEITKNSMNSYVKNSWKNDHESEERDNYWNLNANNQIERGIFSRSFIIYTNSEDENTENKVGRVTISKIFVDKLLFAIRIDNIHISEEYRRQGIFQHIFDSMKTHYYDKKIYLEVLKQNSQATKLYYWNSFRLYEDRAEADKADAKRHRMVYEPEVIYPAEKAYYLDKFSDVMDKLRDNIIIFALFIVSYDFILAILAILEKDIFSTDTNYKKTLTIFYLLTLAVIFTTYDIFASKLYIQFSPKWRDSVDNCSPSWKVEEKPSFLKVILLVFTEFAMIFFNCLVIILSYLLIKYDEDIYYLSLAYASWHLFNFLWYCISPVYLRAKQNLKPTAQSNNGLMVSNQYPYKLRETDRIRKRDFWRHGSYTIGHLTCVVILYYSNLQYEDLIYLLFLTAIVCCTQVLQVRRYMFHDYLQICKSSYPAKEKDYLEYIEKTSNA